MPSEVELVATGVADAALSRLVETSCVRNRDLVLHADELRGDAGEQRGCGQRALRRDIAERAAELSAVLAAHAVEQIAGGRAATFQVAQTAARVRGPRLSWSWLLVIQ